MGGVIPRPLFNILLLFSATVNAANPIINIITANAATAQRRFPISAEISNQKKKKKCFRTVYRKKIEEQSDLFWTLFTVNERDTVILNTD